MPPPPAVGEPWTGRWAPDLLGLSCSTPAAPGWTVTQPPVACDALASAASVRLPRMHPDMLRHSFVTTMLDAGIDLHDVQIAARRADPRTTMR